LRGGQVNRQTLLEAQRDYLACATRKLVAWSPAAWSTFLDGYVAMDAWYGARDVKRAQAA
jgi:hypothetical protein